MKNQEHVRKPGRKKKDLDERSGKFVLEFHKEQNLGARRLEGILKFQHSVHIPYDAS
jgi:hypothetical protein